MSAISWCVVATVADAVSAQVLRERLESEAVQTLLRSDTLILGEGRFCQVLVPEDQVQRARAVLATETFSDAELTLLALAQPGPDGGNAEG
jgi:Putative prokaryotic signal transducing protein